MKTDAPPIEAPSGDAPAMPRKLSFRVSGSRVGAVSRPVADGAIVVAPARRFGLRVHASPLGPAPSAAAPLDSSDYATLDDYKDTP